ncbi:hypothetical protein [Dermatophilus congolensis]|uniref:hypothetical protein n=1 Tax=Dermatophilus congolensis TaxID=1863 RepID=UPI001AAE85DB|nr:hypothetical protein [Dermatophilus congolensis]MBO3143137.1 hypothetical protein [Dermatophilus congolensis]MBO3152123.1 hypothetical protein [Dermatophilus congolensis]MBO3160864.1 hypothetical protein [Dermatophilus congolensis]MBO3163411.1 hypothetical protein [Dermatophilus congolensis]MBO3176961.1 hypothetical protein [Dermatophilus congolensis]
MTQSQKIARMSARIAFLTSIIVTGAMTGMEGASLGAGEVIQLVAFVVFVFAAMASGKSHSRTKEPFSYGRLSRDKAAVHLNTFKRQMGSIVKIRTDLKNPQWNKASVGLLGKERGFGGVSSPATMSS